MQQMLTSLMKMKESSFGGYNIEPTTAERKPYK